MKKLNLIKINYFSIVFNFVLLIKIIIKILIKYLNYAANFIGISVLKNESNQQNCSINFFF